MKKVFRIILFPVEVLAAIVYGIGVVLEYIVQLPLEPKCSECDEDYYDYRTLGWKLSDWFAKRDLFK